MERSECCGSKLLDIETPICAKCLEHCDVWIDKIESFGIVLVSAMMINLFFQLLF